MNISQCQTIQRQVVPLFRIGLATQELWAPHVTDNHSEAGCSPLADWLAQTRAVGPLGDISRISQLCNLSDFRFDLANSCTQFSVEGAL